MLGSFGLCASINTISTLIANYQRIGVGPTVGYHCLNDAVELIKIRDHTPEETPRGLDGR